jgi:hypothetical protein
VSVRTALRPVLCAGLVLAWGSGCASWQTTRTEVVDPIHELLHHTYPHALESEDPRRALALFVGGGSGDVASETLALRAGFSSVDDVRVAIDTVDLEASPVVATVHIVAEGRSSAGNLLTVRQDKVLLLAREGGDWKVLAERSEPAREIPVPPVHFVDETLLRGLRFDHATPRIVDANGTPQRFIYGSGVAAVDVDRDGWTDVLLLSDDRVELFLNREGWFEPASEAWGLGAPGTSVLTVVLPFDFDNDGWKDLFIGAEGAQPVLLRNEGTRFVRVAGSGIITTERTIGATAADFDGDGRLDLFLANHEDVYWNAPDPPGDADNAQPDQLYLNRGAGRFEDWTDEAGVGNTGWSLAPVAADYDRDGDVDLFVGNDFGEDKLYRNDGSARFEEVGEEAGVNLPIASMSADWGDFDGDGDLDLFVGGMRSGSAWVLEAPGFRVDRVPFLIDVLFRPYVREAIRAWFRGNRFYENQGDGTFRDVAAGSGASDSGWAWGSVWLDFDNDGRLDLYGANGFISGPTEDDL